MRNLGWRLAGLVLLLLLLSGGVWAQGGATGAISGVVVDSTGAVVPSAEITIINTATGEKSRTVQTGSDGAFYVPLLPVGTYDVVVRRSGFGEAKVAAVPVRITETTRMQVNMALQKVKQEVTVSAQVQAVETTTATTGESVEHRTITTLPLATQNFQQLLTLSAGTASNLNASASLGRGDVRIEVNGQREDNNNYLIEGISASDYNVAELTNTPLPSPDVVQEFKVQTSLYDATQGRNGGGNINAILRTGTKDLHFDVFEYFRNDVLNANEFFLRRQGQPRPHVKQNIFGGSIGGPVGRNGKLGYFFFNYQGTRQRSGLSAGTLVSTIIPSIPSDRSAQSLANAYFNGDVSQLDPVAVKLLNMKGNQFGGAGGGWLIPSLPPDDPSLPRSEWQSRFNFSHPGRFTDNQFTANWDREFRGGNDKLSSRFFFTNFESLLPFGAGGLQASLGGGISPSDLNFPFDLPVHDRFFSMAETHVFSPRVLNEFRFGYVRINNDAINVPIVKATDLGIDRPNMNIDPLIYKFSLANFQIGPTPAADQTQLQNNFTFLDTVSWTRGVHRVRFGGEVDKVRLDKTFPQVFNGQLFFAPGDGYTDFQNFLRGAPFFSFGGSGVANHQYRINDYALFAQDDFNVTPNLTFNLGLRMEVSGAVRDQLYHIGNTESDLTLQGQSPFIFPKGANRYNVPGLVGTTSPTTMNNNYALDWGPRVGFAYNFRGKNTTAIRGGYGIFYVREDVGAVDQLSFTTPFLPITFAAGPPGTMATLFSTGPGTLPKGGVIDPSFVPVYSHLLGFVDANGNPTTDTTQTPIYDGNTINLFGLEVPRHFVSPNTMQWNFSIERQLPDKWVLEAAYVGTKGTHLRETRDAIQPYFASPQNPVIVTALDGTKHTITENTVANANARSRAPGLAASGYQLFANDAYSHYHSLQLTISHHFARTLSFQGAYTFSKSTDATSSGNTAFNTAVNDQTDLKFSRGLSDFDRTHRFIVSWHYDMPFFSARHDLVQKVLGNWSVAGVVTFQSGLPFSIIDSAGGTAFAPSSPNESMASLAPGATLASGLTSGSIHERLDGYVNINAFQPAPVVGPDGSTGFGNLSRNIYRGPFQQNWDLSLTKTFRINEHQDFKFSTQFFNAWNHPVFNNPSFVDVSGANFGAITSTVGTPRLIQFSARYSF